MPYTTLISTVDLAAYREASWVLVDCRFNLNDTGGGRRAYVEAHIPGAVYAHLDEDLSGRVFPGISGRHPLPDSARFRDMIGRWGIRPGTQVVAYDQGPGAFAARLWWLLKFHGHAEAAVLDGGFAMWTQTRDEVEAGRPVTSMTQASPSETRATYLYPERPPLVVGASMRDVQAGHLLPIDARAPERFRGDVEPLDPVAGHIPGAKNRPFMENVTPAGLFRPIHELHARFAGLGPVEQQVHYCGSGVTAAHNVLAMEVAGMPGARLYPGSWSEWVTVPGNGVAGGSE